MCPTLLCIAGMMVNYKYIISEQDANKERFESSGGEIIVNGELVPTV